MDKVPQETISLRTLRLNSNDSAPRTNRLGFVLDKRYRPPSLVNLCLQIIGENLEDVLIDFEDISPAFPSQIKLAMCAIARRRGMLDDTKIASLADSSWDTLDISSSRISDQGLIKVVSICKTLKSIDISCCDEITVAGVSELLRNCKLLETLRCGGSPSCDRTARSFLSLLKPQLSEVVGESWEDLDAYDTGHSAESVRWLLWPKIDRDSLEMLTKECPRVTVNPKHSLNLTTDTPLDSWVVKDISPSTWAVRLPKPDLRTGLKPKPNSLSSDDEISLAEKFRIAYEERDARLAPKRAKNARQHLRRAYKATKSLHNRG